MQSVRICVRSGEQVEDAFEKAPLSNVEGTYETKQAIYIEIITKGDTL